jgi:hypothetical protein
MKSLLFLLSLEHSQAMLELLDLTKQIPQFRAVQVHAFGQRNRHRRRAEHDRARLNVGGNAGPPGQGGSVSYGDVIGNPHLSAHPHPRPNPYTSGQPDLAGEDRMRPDHGVVTHLHEIVELAALLDDRITHGGAINTRIGADFHVVPDHHAPNLWDLARRTIGQRTVPEAIRSDNSPAMHNNSPAHYDLRIETGVGINDTVITNVAALSDVRTRIDHHTVAETCTPPNHGIGPNMHLLSQDNLGIEDGARIDVPAGVVRGKQAFEERQEPCGWVLNADSGPVNRQGQIDEDSRGTRGSKTSGILGCHDERQLTWLRLLKRSHTMNDGLSLSDHLPSDEASQLGECGLHTPSASNAWLPKTDRSAG